LAVLNGKSRSGFFPGLCCNQTLKAFYLGVPARMRAEANTPAFKAEWLVAANKHPFVADPAGPSMALAYSDHAERYFGPGTELENLKLASCKQLFNTRRG
jgi:hypothetical protein